MIFNPGGVWEPQPTLPRFVRISREVNFDLEKLNKSFEKILLFSMTGGHGHLPSL